MSKQSITEQTRKELLELTEKDLEVKSKSLDRSREQVQLIATITKAFGTSTPELNDLSRLLEFKMLIGFISLDLTTSTRSYLRAEFQYEGLFALRSFIVVINEGYKKIYHFKRTNSNGDEVLSDRNKSFWMKDINRIVSSRSNDGLTEKYNNLTGDLDTYYENCSDGIKELRSLSIHYDEKLIKLYDSISELNSEVIFKKFIPFYELLDQLFIFTHELFMTFDLKKYENHTT